MSWNLEELRAYAEELELEWDKAAQLADRRAADLTRCERERGEALVALERERDHRVRNREWAERAENRAADLKAELLAARAEVASLTAHLAADHASMDSLIARLRDAGLTGFDEGLA